MNLDGTQSLDRALESSIILRWSKSDARVHKRQQAFSRSSNFGRTALLQIQSPTEEAITGAANSVKEAYCLVNSLSREPALS